jgi:hypothetical protein
VAGEAEVARSAAHRVIGEPERSVDRVEDRALVHTVVTTHAIRIRRAVRPQRRVVTTETRVLVNPGRDGEFALGVRPGRGLPGARGVAIAAGSLERAVTGKRAALELCQVTTQTFARRTGELRRVADMALAARDQSVLPVERKRMLEMCGRPAVVVVAAPALQRVQVVLHLLMQRRFRHFVVRSMTGDAVSRGQLHMGHLEVLRTFATQRARGTREAEQKTES